MEEYQQKHDKRRHHHVHAVSKTTMYIVKEYLGELIFNINEIYSLELFKFCIYISFFSNDSI